MAVHTRTITIDIDDAEEGVMVVTSRLADSVHDIILALRVTAPGYKIVSAEVKFDKSPRTGCSQICPITNKLVGLSITRGFTRGVRAILGGGRGCPNVMNLVLVSAPLVINRYERSLRGTTATGTGQKPSGGPDYMAGICIAGG